MLKTKEDCAYSGDISKEMVGLRYITRILCLFASIFYQLTSPYSGWWMLPVELEGVEMLGSMWRMRMGLT